MVVSKIDKNITYKEVLTIDGDDKGKEISPFKSEIKNIPVIIGLGEIKNTHNNKKISYCYLYLILDYNKIIRIGVYEFLADKYSEILDEDNDMDISLMDEPLLFSFITKSYLGKKMENNDFYDEFYTDSDESGDSESDDESSDDESSEGENKDKLESVHDTSNKYGVRVKNVLKEFDLESNIKKNNDDKDGDFDHDHKKTMYNEELNEYEPPMNIGLSAWIQKFMKNNNYKIIENDGAGDCFFYTIESAFKEIKRNVTVAKMRKLLADEATEDKFQTYKDFYNTFAVSINEDKKEKQRLKMECMKLKNEYNDLVKILKSKTTEFKDKKVLLEQAKTAKNSYNNCVTKFKQSATDLKNSKIAANDFKWMENVNNLKDFKKTIQTCNFWADSGAISLIEELLNTKIIILSKTSFLNNQLDNVLFCGDMTPKSIEENGEFNPRYYIMVEHNGIHYRLITYHGKRICEFNDIPLGVQELIVTKCMGSKGKTLYNYIPEFQKLINIKTDMKKEIDEENK
jgi:hypothetical protein